MDDFGGFAELYAHIETVLAHHGDHYEVLVDGLLLKTDR